MRSRVEAVCGAEYRFATMSYTAGSQTSRRHHRRIATLPVALLLALATGCGGDEYRGARLRLAGAQIPVELMESWLREARGPRFETERAGEAVWSQNGFDRLASGEADIACVDRPIGKQELDDLAGKPVEGMRVGFYGFAFYVHPSNKLDSVYAGHIRYLFQRKITDWKELAGQGPQVEGPIRLIGPKKASRGGELLKMQANVFFDRPTWEPKETDEEIIEAVAADPLALGFAAIGLDQGARYLGLRMERTGDPAFPSLDEIESDRYGLAKVIYIYYPTPPTPAVTDLLTYLYGATGRAAIESTGVWPIRRERAAVTSPTEGPGESMTAPK